MMTSTRVWMDQGLHWGWGSKPEGERSDFARTAKAKHLRQDDLNYRLLSSQAFF
jgi:hypothetical protein